MIKEAGNALKVKVAFVKETNTSKDEITEKIENFLETKLVEDKSCAVINQPEPDPKTEGRVEEFMAALNEFNDALAEENKSKSRRRGRKCFGNNMCYCAPFENK
jgi:hypothetical protein